MSNQWRRGDRVYAQLSSDDPDVYIVPARIIRFALFSRRRVFVAIAMKVHANGETVWRVGTWTRAVSTEALTIRDGEVIPGLDDVDL